MADSPSSWKCSRQSLDTPDFRHARSECVSAGRLHPSKGETDHSVSTTYTFENQQLRYSYSIDADAARTFLSAKYPGYVASLATRPMIPLKVKGGGCNPIIKGVPILIPGHH